MIRRITTLSRYQFSSLFFSITGLLYFLLALAFYVVFLDPRQRTPDVDYYILANAIFGATISFLACLSIAGRANRALNSPLLVRLPSRAEYLTSVFNASFGYALLVQALVATLSLIGNGPSLSISNVLEMLAIWVSADILFVVLALHASDLVAEAWSRVYVFGVLAVFLYAQNGIGSVGTWVTGNLANWRATFDSAGLGFMDAALGLLGDWLNGGGPEAIRSFLGILFWPVSAVAEAIIKGYFSPTAALAPALLLLYATGLFILAARFFTYKDLYLSE